jgi:hypothetical protein
MWVAHTVFVLGSINAVKVLLAAGANPNLGDSKPIHEILQKILNNCSDDMLRELIAAALK